MKIEVEFSDNQLHVFASLRSKDDIGNRINVLVDKYGDLTSYVVTEGFDSYQELQNHVDKVIQQSTEIAKKRQKLIEGMPKKIVYVI